MPARFAAAFTMCQIALGVIPSPQIFLPPTYSPEDRATIDARRRGPLIDGAFRPHWNRNATPRCSFPIHEIGQSDEKHSKQREVRIDRLRASIGAQTHTSAKTSVRLKVAALPSSVV